jgi:hypothetical protein
MQIQSVMQVTQQSGCKCIVYGPSGAGKTTLASTAPNPIIINAENGLLSLRRVIKETGRDLPCMSIKSFDDLKQAFDILSGPQGQQFETIVVDSISEVSEVVLADLKKTKKDARQAYMHIQEETMEIIRNFRDMPNMNVVFLAKQGSIMDAGTGMLMNGPLMPGKSLGPAIPYLCDEVFQIMPTPHPENPQLPGPRYLRTFADQQNTAKDRSGMLDPWEPANLTNVFSKMLNA